MGEQTIIKTMPTPVGRDYVWHADCNIVVLSDRLSRLGRIRALTEFQVEWRLHLLISEESLPPLCDSKVAV